MKQRFRFPSFLSHMFLHQNPDFFKKHVKLAIFDESGKRRSVSIWTSLLSSTYDYYAFLDYFLVLILQDLRGEDSIDQLTKEQTRYMQNFTPNCDQFLGIDFTFIWICSFTKELFHLLACVTNWVLALNFFWKVSIINYTFCGGPAKKEGFFVCPLSFKMVVMAKNKTHKLLEHKITHLGLVMICDRWNFNPKNDFPNEFFKVVQNP